MALTKISTGGVKDDAASQAIIADEAVDEARLQISNAGSNGQFLSKQSGNTGGLTWAAVDSTPEGTVIKSTGESGTTKFLRVDGDGTSSWQVPPDTVYTHPNHSGEVTSTADGAQVIANDVVDEANLKVSNAPTNGHVLTAQSGNTGGLTWAAPGGGAWEEISQTSVSNGTTSMDWTWSESDISDYHTLVLWGTQIQAQGSGVRWEIRLKTGSTWHTAANYAWVYREMSSYGGMAGTHNGSQDHIKTQNYAYKYMYDHITYIYNNDASVASSRKFYPAVWGHNSGNEDDTRMRQCRFAGHFKDVSQASDITGIRLMTQYAAYFGTFRLYGIKK